jgi:hypothetical protein
MKKSLKYRLHEWAADRFQSVQYPSVKSMNDAGNLQAPIRFAHAMPFWRRVDIILISLGGIVIAGIVLFFLCLIAWSLITG